MVRQSMSAAEQAAAAEVLLSTLEHLAAQNPRLTLGTVMAFLSVVKWNGPTIQEEQRLAQLELWAAAARHREGFSTFSASLTKLSTRVVATVTGKQPAMSLIEIVKPAQDYRQAVPRLTAEGQKLAATLAREMYRLRRGEEPKDG